MKKNALLNKLTMELGLESLEGKELVLTDAQFDKRYLGQISKKAQVNALSVTIDYDIISHRYMSRIEVSALSESRTIQTGIHENIKIRDKDRIAHKKRFIWDSLSLKLTEQTAQRIGDIAFGGTITTVYHPKTGWVKVFIKKELSDKTLYFDVEDGLDYREDQMPTGHDYVIREYKLDPVTASGSRNKSGVFRDVTVTDNRFEVFNNATAGAIRKQYETFLEELDKVTNEDDLNALKRTLRKAYGYMGNVATGSKNLGLVNNFHVYRGKWLNSTSESFLTKEFIGLMETLNKLIASGADIESIESVKAKMDDIVARGERLDKAATQDGQMYINAVELAKLIYNSTGLVVDPEVLVGRMIQIRPATIKASAVVVNPFVYKGILNGSKALAEKFETEVECYGDESSSLFIADMNCIKLNFEMVDMAEFITFELLAFNKTSEGDASKQIYKNVLYAAQKKGELSKFVGLIKELESLTVNEKMAKAIDTTREAIMLSPTEILASMESGFITNVVSSIAPGFTRESKTMMESNWRQVVNSIVNDIDRMHGALKVESRRLASDPTFIITGGKLDGILRLGQSFINNKSVTKSIMFKYPVAGLEEQYANENVSLTTIIKTCKKFAKSGVITNTECSVIIDFFAGLKRTVRVLPALMFLANACAGLDFDYDGECSIIKVKDPKTRTEEISNEFVDLLFDNGIRGVSINI